MTLAELDERMFVNPDQEILACHKDCGRYTEYGRQFCEHIGEEPCTHQVPSCIPIVYEPPTCLLEAEARKSETDAWAICD